MASLAQQIMRRKPLALPSAKDGAGLSRSLGTFQLMMFGVGCTVGTGIFFVMQEAVPKAGPAVIVSFVVAGIAAGLSCLCYAELASAIPVSGSTYSYAYHAFGEFPAVMIAACVILEYGISTSAVAVGWSGYFNELIKNTLGFKLPDALSYPPLADGAGPTGLINLPAVVLIVLCGLLLIKGASESAKANVIMVMVKLVVLLLFVVIAFSAFNADHFSGFWAKGPTGIAAAAGTIFFSFIGLDAVATGGEEVKNPQKALPRALFGALAIVVGIYLLVAVAGIGSQPTDKFADPNQQDAGLAVILENITGTTVWATILAAGAVISIFSVALVCYYAQTRNFFAIGRDGLLPAKFAQVDPRTQTPVFNTKVVGVIVMLIAGFVPAGYLWDTISIGTLIAFSAVAVGIVVLRRREPDLARPFRVPLFPFTPIVTVLACGYVLSGLRGVTWLIFGSWMVVVAIYYFSWARHHSKLNTDPNELLEDSL